MSEPEYELKDLLRVMERLRDPVTGCPWDIKQDFHSIVPSTLEECYELAQAIEDEDFDHVADELGDVLFQVIFYSQMGKERGLFTFDNVINGLVEKLLRRHPHVFASGEVEGASSAQSSTIRSVNESWEAIKQQERASMEDQSLLANIPRALPAIPRAQKLQSRAAKVEFDWDKAELIVDKLEEEIAELRAAMLSERQHQIEEEVGDLLFTCVNLARHLGADAEASLRRSNAKFEKRFRYMETQASKAGRVLEDYDATGKESLWCAAKCQEQGQ